MGRRIPAIGRLLRWSGMLLMAASTSAGTYAQPASPRLRHLTIVVPAAVGGGWDLTAKAMKASLEHEHLVSAVDIVRFPGAGGLVGLSQFNARFRGRGDALMVGGLVMLAATLRDQSAVGMRDVAPIARLTGDWSMLVTSSRSPIQSASEIKRALSVDPTSIRWAGGSLGGPDQGLVWKIAEQIGAPVEEISYYGRPGGRSVADALVEGRIDVGLSGYAEFSTFLADSRLRVLAVASPSRIPGIDAPTLREWGIDATMMNWRGVFAPHGLAAAQEDELAAVVAAMARSPSWQASLRANRWTDTYLDSGAFAQFIDREQGRWSEVVNPPARTKTLRIPATSLRIDRRILAMLTGVLALLTALAAILGWRLHRRQQAALALETRCGDLKRLLDESSVDPAKLVKDGIDNDFGEWKLSAAEADIAWFMLRGLPLREIAALRGTSERTVRQQAQAIYRKAGLDGRSDLAGRVLERFI